MRTGRVSRLAALLSAAFFVFSSLFIINAAETGDSTNLYEEIDMLDSGAATPRIGLGSITVKMTNSVTSQGLAGVEFELCSLLSFSGQVYTATTDSTGTCSFPSLSLGIWYLRQINGPAGYIPYLDILPVSVGPLVVSLDLKSTPYGSIEVEKTDDLGGAVQGAEFSLYSGLNTSGTPIKTGLTTGADGKVLLKDITPGTYTLLETAAPAGYHLNTMAHTFEVLAGNKRTVAVVNNTIKRGAINLIMRDAATNDQLAGALLGVYRDPAFQDKLEQAVSMKDAPAVVNNLLPGTYYVKVLAVPDGYLSDAPPQTILLLEGQVKEVTFLNNRSYPTAGNFGLPLVCGLFGLAVCGLLALCMQKRS